MRTTIDPTTEARPGRGASRSRGVLIVAVAVALLATACAGGGGDVADDPAADGTVQPGDEAAVPTADDTDGAPVSSAVCIEEEPDCEDTIVVGDGEELGDAGHGGAASSCLAGDEDCTDESYGGQDVARPVRVVSDPTGAEPAPRGDTDGATGAPIDAVAQLDGSTIEITFTSGTCDVVQDVVVVESPAEVRLMVLTGMDPAVEVCTADVQQWTVETELAAPIGDRAVLDISG